MTWTRLPITNVALPEDTRQPVCWLNYKRPQHPNPLAPMGPTYNGETLWPVAVEGNRIGFSYQPPPGYGATT